MNPPERPYTLVAELTYRCPLRCAYCSNPIRPAPPCFELATGDWQRVFREAAELGVVQLNLSGGEPLLRPDLEDLVAAGAGLGLYVNLITSGIPFVKSRVARLAAAGLDSVQISFQDVDAENARRIAGSAPLAQKLGAARAVKDFGLALTLNVVLHRLNIDQLPQMLKLAIELEPERIELANVQFLGWALSNRDSLLPSREQVDRAHALAAAARERLRGRVEVLYVASDYHTGAPRPCMGGWARHHIVVSPDGLVLPCHAAHTISGMEFDNVRAASLAWIWRESQALNAFRGEAWMREPCKSCERRTLDFGGCRCQAFHLIGDSRATDPACRLSPEHDRVAVARRMPPGSRSLVQLRTSPVSR